MNRILTIITSVALLAAAAPAMASEVTGTLSTGVQTGVTGTVAAAPTAAPGAGKYTSTQSVTLTATSSDSIHYLVSATSSTDPTCSTGTTYTGPITVSTSETIRAVACYGSATSPVGVFAYGINIPSTPPPATGGGGGSSGGGSTGGGGGALTPTTTTWPIGDINHDGKVNVLDFNALLVQWGETGANLTADLNHDGVVDILDFNILMAHMQ